MKVLLISSQQVKDPVGSWFSHFLASPSKENGKSYNDCIRHPSYLLDTRCDRVDALRWSHRKGFDVP
ncbi:hypothetical protein F2Q69_00054460 [Brassica cretica]|uniref:Uncharacterized protein n=1 Tax=Brassica cretica TaxID=69181 RepID=A0A8S9N908_BRACR|nr:hypothetical protein F2Q69_00054460 [Brassica cretica]